MGVDLYIMATRFKHGNVRQKLITAAYELSIKRGSLDKMSLAQIAKVADIPLNLVFHYFKTKKSIIDTVAILVLNKNDTNTTLNLATEELKTIRLLCDATLHIRTKFGTIDNEEETTNAIEP